MSEFILEFENSIPNILCNEIITLFEEETKFSGLTLGGIQKNILDSDDFVIPKNSTTWNKIEIFLHKELSKKLIKYLHTISSYYSNDYKFLSDSKLYTEMFIIRRYTKDIGKYVFHIDEHPEKKRIITFIWYLNTVENGGETYFYNGVNIKPEQGKLLMFPSSWTYPHSSKNTISDNKYVILGWVEKM